MTTCVNIPDGGNCQVVCQPGLTASQATITCVSGTWPAPLPTCNAIACKCAVMTVLDASGSVNNADPNNWNRILNFTLALADNFNLGPNSIEMGVITFATTVVTSIPITYNRPTLDSTIPTITYLNGATFTDDALQSAVTQLSATGYTCRAILIVTDGVPTTGHSQPALDIANTFKAGGGRLLGIGVGQPPALDPIFMEQLVSAPWVYNFWLISDFTGLASLVSQLTSQCLVQTTFPTLTPSTSETPVPYVPPPCILPPSVNNSKSLASCANTPSGGVCMVTCNTGFTLSAPSALCVAGTWQNVPTCTPTPCVNPPVVGNATSLAMCANTPSGNNCTITCLAGYTPTNPMAMCNHGTWVSVPTCNPNPCVQPPMVAFAGDLHLCAYTPSGSSCTLVCQPGYTPSAPVVPCNLGSWTITPTCDPAPCMTPPVIGQSGNLSNCVGTASNTSCTITCMPGYTPVPTNQAPCLLGSWIGTPTCGPAPCTTPPNVTNAVNINSCVNTPSGSVCTITCMAGYSIFPTTTTGVLCFTGSWQSQPSCNPNPCVNAPVVANSMPLNACAGTPSGGICTVTCLAGYTPSAPSALCNAGSWQNVPTCNPNPCTTVPMITHSGNLSPCAPTPSGMSCSLTCMTGYQPSAIPIQCKAGSWVNPPTCNPMPCLLPPVLLNQGNMQYCANTSSGNNCTLACLQGYVATPPVALCTLGSWSPATCGPAPCVLPPVISHSGNLSSCANTPSNSLCTVSCQIGYWVSIPPTAQCLLGSWVPGSLPTCSPDPCTVAPMITNAADLSYCVFPTPTPSGMTCAITCQPGYDVTPASPGSALCSLGNWTNQPTCAPSPCIDPPIIANSADLTYCSDTPNNQTCAVTCDDGYAPNWQNAKCVLGNWTNVPSCLPAPCMIVPTITNGANMTYCVPTNSSGLCRVTCKTGFSPTANITCFMGAWQIPPTTTCTPNPCMTVPNITHGGNMTSCLPTASNATCQVVCQTGYVPSAPSALCYAGQWQPGVPTCVPAPCSQPVDPANGTYSACPSTPSNSSCTLKCDPGFNKTGDGWCLYGQWKTPAPTCKPLGCSGPAPVPDHGEYVTTCSNVPNNFTCAATCDYGYLKQSDAHCWLGNWTAPVCLLNNKPPTATPVNISGAGWPGSLVTGSYTYNDPDGDLEGATRCQWYRAEDPQGTAKVAIPGATNCSYVPTKDDGNMYLSLVVTPVALTGVINGTPAESPPLHIIANVPPTADPVTIDERWGPLTASYVYRDKDLDPEGASVLQWYWSPYPNCSAATAIVGANNLTYTPPANATGYLYFQVIPVAKTGAGPGAPAQSACQAILFGPTITATITPFLQKDYSWKPWVWPIVTIIAVGMLGTGIVALLQINKFRKPDFGAFREDDDFDTNSPLPYAQ